MFTKILFMCDVQCPLLLNVILFNQNRMYHTKFVNILYILHTVLVFFFFSYNANIFAAHARFEASGPLSAPSKIHHSDKKRGRGFLLRFTVSVPVQANGRPALLSNGREQGKHERRESAAQRGSRRSYRDDSGHAEQTYGRAKGVAPAPARYVRILPSVIIVCGV